MTFEINMVPRIESGNNGVYFPEIPHKSAFLCVPWRCVLTLTRMRIGKRTLWKFARNHHYDAH